MIHYPPSTPYSDALRAAFFPRGFLSLVFCPALGRWLLKIALALAKAIFIKSGRYPFLAVVLTIDLATLRFDL